MKMESHGAVKLYHARILADVFPRRPIRYISAAEVLPGSSFLLTNKQWFFSESGLIVPPTLLLSGLIVLTAESANLMPVERGKKEV